MISILCDRSTDLRLPGLVIPSIITRCTENHYIQRVSGSGQSLKLIHVSGTLACSCVSRYMNPVLLSFLFLLFYTRRGWSEVKTAWRARNDFWAVELSKTVKLARVSFLSLTVDLQYFN